MLTPTPGLLQELVNDVKPFRFKYLLLNTKQAKLADIKHVSNINFLYPKAHVSTMK